MKKASFQERVYMVVRGIPKGKVMTYKEVAKKAGRPLAFRAVGNLMSKNADKSVPCHRVIRSDGKVGGYNGLQGQKRMLLAKEGYLK